MPRGPRKISSCNYYHVMMHGVSNEPIFSTSTFKNKFLAVLQEVQEDIEFEIITYCIMTNHVHLFIYISEEEFSIALKRINIKYAQFYNRCKQRKGHVFQDRFKSEIVDSPRYFYTLIRYIHNNPVKANLCTSIDAYPWSGAKEFTLMQPHIIHTNILEQILNNFTSIASFINYHNHDDFYIYIDLPEDIQKRIILLADIVIDQYLQSRNKSHILELTVSEKETLVKELLAINKLTYHQISDYTSVSLYRIGAIKRQFELESDSTIVDKYMALDI